MMRQKCKLPFLDALVFLHSLGGDSRGRLCRVVLLYVGGGGGDGSPSLATTDADCYGCEDDRAKKHNGQ